MAHHIYTVDEAADFLNLHVKTVRRYLREGRLKGKRIGKQYRIGRADLEEFAGGSPAVEAPVARARHFIASSIVDVDAISPEESHRITTLLLSGLNARKGHEDYPRLDSIYYAEQGKLRITITASPALTAGLLQTIDALLESGRDQHL